MDQGWKRSGSNNNKKTVRKNKTLLFILNMIVYFQNEIYIYISV